MSTWRTVRCWKIWWSKCEPWKMMKKGDAFFASDLKKTLYNKETTKVLMIFYSDFISLARSKRWDWFYLFLSSLKGIKHPTSSAQNTAPPLYQVASFRSEIWKLLKLLGNIGWKKMLACIKEGVCPNGLPAQLHWMGCCLSSWNERHRAVILLMGSQGSHTALTEVI